MSSTALVAVGIFGLILVSFTGQCYGELEGCDASILLDGSSCEKTVPNLSIQGYEVIDAAKSAVETVCPGVVSCSDIIVMATREAVYLSGGGRYNVQTGRRVTQSVAAFARKGLNAHMVYLLEGHTHTIGVAHCFLFHDRLYNFQNTGKPDLSMDSSLLKKLRLICRPNSAGRNTAKLDQNDRNLLSSFIVDNSFYSVTAANSWPSTRKQYKIHTYLLQDHLMVTEQ